MLCRAFPRVLGSYLERRGLAPLLLVRKQVVPLLEPLLFVLEHVLPVLEQLVLVWHRCYPHYRAAILVLELVLHGATRTATAKSAADFISADEFYRNAN